MRSNLLRLMTLSMLILLLFGCDTGIKPDASDEQSSGEMSLVQVYNTIKDCDYWHYSFDGVVTAFKGDEEIILYGESGICDVQFVDGWLYYVKAYDRFSSDFKIFRVRPNGKDLSIVLNSVDLEESSGSSFHSVAFAGKHMYVQEGFQFYDYDFETKKVTKIADDVGDYQVRGNELYFIDHAGKTFTIYVMDLTTKSTKILLGDGEYSDRGKAKALYKNFIFVDEVMYYYVLNTDGYIDDEVYYRNPNPDGVYSYIKGESKLIDDSVTINPYSFFEYNGMLYYIIIDDGTKIMQYDPKDKKVTEVLSLSDYSGEPKIKDGYFYYISPDDKAKKVKISVAI